jgi:hypothetical protein
MIALTTQGHIPLLTADDHLLVVGSVATIGEGGRRSIGTSATEGRETFHMVRQRDAVEKLSERSAIGVSVETDEIEMLPQGIDDPFHKRHKSTKKVGLVHDQDIVANEVLGNQVIKALDRETGGMPCNLMPSRLPARRTVDPRKGYRSSGCLLSPRVSF